MRRSDSLTIAITGATLAFLSAMGASGLSLAQEPGPPPAPSAPAETTPQSSAPPADQGAKPVAAPTLEDLQRQIAELKALLLDQQALIEAQKKKIAEQAGDISEQAKKLEEMQRSLESTTRRLDELQGELPSSETQKAIEERLKRVEKTTDKTPELPPNVVSAGDFPGSIRIPGPCASWPATSTGPTGWPSPRTSEGCTSATASNGISGCSP